MARGEAKTRAHMTRLLWYSIEVDKLIKLGYDNAEASKIVQEQLSDMTGIEWTPDNNNLTVLLDNREAL